MCKTLKVPWELSGDIKKKITKAVAKHPLKIAKLK